MVLNTIGLHSLDEYCLESLCCADRNTMLNLLFLSYGGDGLEMANVRLNSRKCREADADGVSTELIKVYSQRGEWVPIVKSAMKAACIFMRLQLDVVQGRLQHRFPTEGHNIAYNTLDTGL